MDKTYYQFLIYDNDREDCYHEDGVIIEVSNLYTTKRLCEEYASKMVDEFHNEYETEDRFQYEIIEVGVVD